MLLQIINNFLDCLNVRIFRHASFNQMQRAHAYACIALQVANVSMLHFLYYFCEFHNILLIGS